MNRTLLKRVIPQVLIWAGLVALCAVIAVAQAPDPNSVTVTAAPIDQRTDGQIEMDVVHALDASKALKSDLITAATIQGEVTLSGTVSSEASSELAESIAAHVEGVAKVHNNLKVGNPQAAQAAQPAAPGAQQMADSQADESMAPVPPPLPAMTDGPLPPPGQSPDQGQAPHPAQRPQWVPANPRITRMQPPAPAYETPKGPVTISQGTLLQVRTAESLNSKRAKDGEPVQFMVIQDVTMGGVLAIPRGAVVHGVVSEHKNVGSGSMGGSSSLTLTLTSLDLGGRNYPLQSDQFKVKAPNKAGQTVGSALTGGVIGTIIGCAVGRGEGCAIGAGAGVAGGTALGAAEPGYRAWIPAEALVTFHLAAPVTVVPVGPQEAARLAQGLYPGGPALYRRAPYGSPYYGYGYGPGYYAYPPPYYRPYFIVGGAYYWR